MYDIYIIYIRSLFHVYDVILLYHAPHNTTAN